MRYLTKRDLSILIGNALDNFDTSIYAFLAPLLAPVFFPNHDPVVQLILAYSVMMVSIVARPLGAFIFGIIARKKGPVFGLSYSLIGVAIATVYTGFLPTYDILGWLAPFSLIFVRFLKAIFAAGESTIAKLYLMEGKGDREALKISHLYQSSSILGTIMASGAASLVITFLPDAWRLCFWVGGITGVFGYFLRRYSLRIDPHNSSFYTYSPLPILKLTWQNRLNIFRVAMGTGFGHLTYAIPFVFMNSFIPLITSISLETMMLLNTTLLILDMVIIPFIGRFLINFQPTIIMGTASLALSFTILPLFYYLPNASLAYVIFVRLWIVFWGVVFLCPLNFWFKSLFNTPEQYLLVGMGTALGASTLGRSLTPFCLWLWYTTDHCVMPALYIGLITLTTAYTILGNRSQKPILQETYTNLQSKSR